MREGVGAHDRARPEADEGERSARALRRLGRAFRSPDSYGLVLVMIVTTYALAVTVGERRAAIVVVVAQIATVWLAVRTSKARRGVVLAANLLFLAAIAAGIADLVAAGDHDVRPWLFLASSLLYVVAPVTIVRHVAYRAQVDQETMLGALAAYLLIGMAFAFTYRFLAGLQDAPFFGDAGDGTMSDDLFFSFVTLTTTGYGNLVPAGNPGQSLAVMEALVGQLFLVTAVGKIVSAWQPRAWRDRDAG